MHIFRKPTLLEQTQHDLDEARRKLAEAELWAEHFEHTVAMYRARVSRLAAKRDNQVFKSPPAKPVTNPLASQS